jgi:cytochrome c oxidase subunit 2
MAQIPRLARRWWQFGLLVSTLLLLAGCGGDLPATTLHTNGNHARNIYELLVFMFWTGLGVFVVVEGALIYTVFRYRRRENAAIPSQVHGNTTVEIAWTVLPALIVLVISILTFRTQALNSVQPQDALKITATGYQWWYGFEYPDEGIVTASDMYIPVGRDVTVELKARDVIHSFWVPRLAGKTDMIPGHTNRLSFKAEQVGLYYAHCSVLCGESHANMAFRVVVVSQEEYDAWVTKKKTPPAESTGDAARGKEVFLKKYGCIGCHAVSGTNAQGITGPNLTYYGDRSTIAAGVLPYSRENLALWLRNPNGVKPGNLMGAAVREGTITEQDVADLVAYLDSMKTNVVVPPLVGK